MIRKATKGDLEHVARIYEKIHDAESAGTITTGWLRGIYPTYETAAAALGRDDLFVLTEDGEICGAAIINKEQVDVYADGNWKHPAPEENVLVIHTLVIRPDRAGRGLGKAFIDYYEEYARQCGCTALRLDTNSRNTTARRFYASLGYEEIGIVPTVFNGIPGVDLVLIEKGL